MSGKTGIRNCSSITRSSGNAAKRIHADTNQCHMTGAPCTLQRIRRQQVGF